MPVRARCIPNSGSRRGLRPLSMDCTSHDSSRTTIAARPLSSPGVRPSGRVVDVEGPALGALGAGAGARGTVARARGWSPASQARSPPLLGSDVSSVVRRPRVLHSVLRGVWPWEWPGLSRPVPTFWPVVGPGLLALPVRLLDNVARWCPHLAPLFPTLSCSCSLLELLEKVGTGRDSREKAHSQRIVAGPARGHR